VNASGQSQFLTTPIPAQPLSFNLALDDPNYGDDDLAIQRLQDSDSRLVEMLASQARLKEDNMASGEDAILSDDNLSEQEKRDALQGMFTMAASNGEAERVRSILNGSARSYIDVDMPDAEGTPPLIYASCFGHEEVVSVLLDAKADVNAQDKNQWSSLMWAMTNRHKAIAKLLLDHGADPDVKSSTGRTAFDFLAPNSEMSEYLHESGYDIGSAGVADDWYNPGLSQDRFEEEMAEKELKQRMMMESAINLEVDLGNLGLDEQPEVCEIR
jgi:Ankyrin repeats (3 copies)